MFDKTTVSTAWQERDASGLTDRETLDVLGLVVSTAIVTWLLFMLSQELAPSGVAIVPMLATLATLAYLASWVEELGRHTLDYIATWRYGVSG